MGIPIAAAAPPFLAEVVALIVCGALIAYLGYRLGLVPIVGFLLTGVVIGPNGLGLVSNLELVNATAEIGVILLLFTIGIEFSLDKLARIKRLIFGAGGMQVVLATALTTVVLLLFGVSWQAGVFTGFLVALSSTAIVLKLLATRGQSGSEPGQVSLGVLIFQDLAIIVMVMLVPILAGEGGSPLEILWALGKAGVMIVAVLFGARKLMPPVLERVARTCSQELFLLTLIALCFGTAYLSSLAGVSVALGAFLAGLIVSESRFAEHAFGEIMPLQILFAATFFVSVGMLLDLRFLLANPLLVLALVAVVLVVKIATTAVSVRALGYGWPTAAAAGMTLAQVGEFSFVLESAGREYGLFPAGLDGVGSQAFIAATVILMVLTPPISQFGMRLGRKLEAQEPAESGAEGASPVTDEEAEVVEEGEVTLSNHVVVAGYSLPARRLARLLRGADVPHVVITLSPPRAREAEQAGSPVVRGDATRQRALLRAGLSRAKLLVLPADSVDFSHRVAVIARTTNPTLRIVAHTAFAPGAETLDHAGADRVLTDEYEQIVPLFAEILRDFRMDPAEIDRCLDLLRHDGYGVFHTEGADATLSAIADLLDTEQATRTVHLREGAQAVGQSIAALDLEAHGVNVTGLRRGRTAVSRPPEHLELKVDDELELVGTIEGFEAVGRWFGTRLLDFPEGQDGAAADVAESLDEVHVYGADWCPLTGGFRAYLKRHEIPFTYHNIEADAEAEAVVKSLNDGKIKFPMVVVGSRAMKNPDIDTLNEALEEAGLLEGSEAGG